MHESQHVRLEVLEPARWIQKSGVAQGSFTTLALLQILPLAVHDKIGGPLKSTPLLSVFFLYLSSAVNRLKPFFLVSQSVPET